ncbi:hypothetical protein ILYODFUR_024684 [Ilyodon furcidens]|uniref:Uncharacterized protein n=1 Tax=Ilyodon furcidens TaxID=33524 RepID=A0ABV0TYN5_9TELE
MNSTCFTSSNPAAVNANIVYDFNSDHESLWEKPDLQASLPLCNSSAPSSVDSACLVCREQKVFAVCRSLPDGVKVVMEAVGNNMEITESGNNTSSQPLFI